MDPEQALSFGLVAEDVAQVSPELITRDEEGKPQTVRYEAVNAMLLNEFLKEHRKFETQTRKLDDQDAKIARFESTIAQQQKEIQTLIATVREQSAQIQKVSARLAAASPSSGGLDAGNAVAQTASNDR
jgi:septal ring factor EnvC (AmiA/AmiB activator)